MLKSEFVKSPLSQNLENPHPFCGITQAPPYIEKLSVLQRKTFSIQRNFLCAPMEFIKFHFVSLFPQTCAINSLVEKKTEEKFR